MTLRLRNELFEMPSPPYSHLTVRRAFIVWLQCGQINKFKEVCNYYHVLERLEEQLSPVRRTRSRRLELNLFTNRPPSSIYLNSHHPALYDNTQLNHNYVSKVEAIRNDKCVFKYDGFRKFCKEQILTTKQVLDTSKLIREYCQGRYITLDKFLIEFEKYAKRCNLSDTVSNVWGYLQNQLIKDEITMIYNWPDNFSFLDDDDEVVPYSLSKIDDYDDSEALKIPMNDWEALKIPMSGLNNQKKLLHSINVMPNMLDDILHPWRIEKMMC